MKEKKLYLSRQRSGLYMLTALKPKINKIRGVNYSDLYIQIGEPFGFRNMCTESVEILTDNFSEHLAPLESRKVLFRQWSLI